MHKPVGSKAVLEGEELDAPNDVISAYLHEDDEGLPHVQQALLSEESLDSEGRKSRRKKDTCMRVLFNVLVGQLIAVGLVSGGVFT